MVSDRSTVVHPMYYGGYSKLPSSCMLQRSRPHARGQGYTSQATTFGGSNAGENALRRLCDRRRPLCLTSHKLAQSWESRPFVARLAKQQFVVLTNSVGSPRHAS